MSGTILTPVAIWRNFIVADTPKATVLGEKKVNGVTYTDVRLQGRSV